jgi:type IV secretory pathway VirB10-like protein
VKIESEPPPEPKKPKKPKAPKAEAPEVDKPEIEPPPEIDDTPPETGTGGDAMEETGKSAKLVGIADFAKQIQTSLQTTSEDEVKNNTKKMVEKQEEGNRQNAEIAANTKKMAEKDNAAVLG